MHVSEKHRTAPDWLYWHAHYQATPDECVCLSLDVEPCPTDGAAFQATPQLTAKQPAEHEGEWAAPIAVGGMSDRRSRVQLRHDIRDQEAISTLNALGLEANGRLLMLHKHLRANRADLQPFQGEDGRVRVRLVNFARWANKAGWVLPQELTLNDLRPSSAAAREPQGNPPSAHDTESDDVKPLQRAPAQDNAILAAIAKAGHNPLRLPKHQPGKPGVKSKIRAATGNNKLFAGTTVFNKAWERLFRCGELAYSP